MHLNVNYCLQSILLLGGLLLLCHACEGLSSIGGRSEYFEPNYDSFFVYYPHLHLKALTQDGGLDDHAEFAIENNTSWRRAFDLRESALFLIAVVFEDSNWTVFPANACEFLQLFSRRRRSDAGQSVSLVIHSSRNGRDDADDGVHQGVVLLSRCAQLVGESTDQFMGRLSSVVFFRQPTRGLDFLRNTTKVFVLTSPDDTALESKESEWRLLTSGARWNVENGPQSCPSYVLQEWSFFNSSATDFHLDNMSIEEHSLRIYASHAFCKHNYDVLAAISCVVLMVLTISAFLLFHSL